MKSAAAVFAEAGGNGDELRRAAHAIVPAGEPGLIVIGCVARGAFEE